MFTLAEIGSPSGPATEVAEYVRNLHRIYIHVPASVNRARDQRRHATGKADRCENGGRFVCFRAKRSKAAYAGANDRPGRDGGGRWSHR